MKRIIALMVIGFLLGIAGPAAAAPEWQFDPNHGEIVFKVQHVLGFVTGVFEKYNGTVRFDPNDPASSSIEVTIEVDSLNTRVAKRDEHLRSKDFFEVKKYPTIKFVSNEIRNTGGNQYIAKGQLTMKDVTKTIELPFTFLGIVDNPFEKSMEIAGFDAQYTLDRLEYNVGDGKYYKQGVVGKDVEISLRFEMVRNK